MFPSPNYNETTVYVYMYTYKSVITLVILQVSKKKPFRNRPRISDLMKTLSYNTNFLRELNNYKL